MSRRETSEGPIELAERAWYRAQQRERILLAVVQGYVTNTGPEFNDVAVGHCVAAAFAIQAELEAAEANDAATT